MVQCSAFSSVPGMPLSLSLSPWKGKDVSTRQPGYTWVVFSVVIGMAALAMQNGGTLLAVMVALIVVFLVFLLIVRTVSVL